MRRHFPPLTDRQKALVEEYVPLVYWFVNRYGDRYGSDRDELISESMFILCGAAKMFRKKHGVKFKTYVVNLLQKELGWQKAKSKRPSISLEEDRVPDPVSIEDHESAADCEKLRRRLQRMPQKEREVMRRVASGDVMAHIALDLGLTRQRISQVYYSGLVKLRKLFGVEETAVAA